MWRTQEGLPENRIQAISGTPDGYLWIGTPGGLVRFDGVRFVVYNRANTPAFVDDSVSVLYTSSEGVLWAGTDGGGLVRLKDREFRSYGQHEGLTDGFIRAIQQDSHGALWVGSAHGLFHLEGERFIRAAEPPELPISVFWAIARRNGALWAQSTLGWYRIEGNRLVGHPLPILAAEQGAPDCPAPIQALTSRAALPGAAAPPSYRDHAGDLWIGGIGLSRAHACAITQWPSPDILPGKRVTSIFEDPQHSIWIGTEDGLLRLSRSTVTTLNENDGFADSNISNVYVDPSHTVWVTTLTGQVYRLVDGKAVRYPLPPEIKDPRILTIFRDSRGTLWLGTSNRGFIGLSNGHAERYSRENGLRSEVINDFFEDSSGRLWIGTSGGLIRWDGKTFRGYHVQDGLAYSHVRAIAQDFTGDLLVGTDGGLNRVHRDKIAPDPLFARLGTEKITSIYVDKAHSIWLGTRGDGLIRIGGGKISRVTTGDGLISKSIYQLLGDGRGRLWMSSPKGIFSASMEDLNAVAEDRSPTLAVSAYGIADGLETTQMSGGIQPAGALLPDGRLAFASVKGLVLVDPNRARLEKSSPVHIESVLVDDIPVPLRGDVTVAAGHRELQIDFTAPSLLAPERLSFRYRLRNLSDEWNIATNPRSARYANLAPGRYVFEVEARDGAIPGKVSRAAVTVIWKAHFYRTWWFLSMVTLAFGAALWLAFRYYEHQQKMRYAVRLSERTRIARDMHDTVIQGCVGASTLLEAAAGFADSEAPPVMEFLDRARVQLRLTLDEARQALTDLRHDSFAAGLGGALQELARGVSREAGVEVEVKIDGSPRPLPEPLSRNLLLVAREAIRNSVAHSGAARIEVCLSFAPTRLDLEIRDNGRGFPAARPDFCPTDHFGITGMRERVEQMGGSFTVRSAQGEGTGIHASLPLHPGGDAVR
ncbi:MAG TPA: two-component regulator propeller domain-containing protein [Bryobacteraceae bacterium]|nr:two-component regulator propeller domain-containing protein [Bryobacteraceae bacterium]